MTTLRSILVSLHGTAGSPGPGLELALAWARRSGAELMGLGVIDETVAEPTAVPIGGTAFKQDEEAALISQREQSAREAQAVFAERCRAENIPFRGDVRSGVPHEVVAEEAQRHDLTVIQRHPADRYGAGESPAVLLEHLLKVFPRPVVAAPRSYLPGDGVLVAYDGSVQASRALFGLLGCGLRFLGDVHVVTVDAQSKEAACARAESGLEYLRRHEIATHFTPVVSEGSVSEVLCEEAQRRGCELIVMGARVRSPVVEFFLGSTTKKIVEHSPVPVFLFR